MKLGFIGLGVMGGNITKRLLDAGHTVTGFNRTRSKADWLIRQGMQWADTPKAAAASGEIIFSMVTDSAALEAVVRGSNGILAGLRPGSVYVEMSTVSPILTRELASEVADRGASMLDAPVSGSVATIHEGQLSFMVGGEKSTLARVLPVLRDIGPKVTWVGGNGQGTLMKVATNLQVFVQTLALAESLRLAERGGVDRSTAMEVLLNSAIASPMLKYRGPFMLEPPQDAWFTISMSLKDLDLALSEGRRLGVALPSTEAAAKAFAVARELGMSEQEAAAVIDALPHL